MSSCEYQSQYSDINSKTWDLWAKEGCEWSVPISHEEYAAAQRGEYRVYLTPCIPVPTGWLGQLKGAALLGLASGGGQQMPIFTALGAHCTVLDYSDQQLKSEYEVSKREGYIIDIVKADMTKRLPFSDASFDLIFHPVSNVYIKDVQHVWNESFRILRPGGTLLAGLDNGLNFLFEDDGKLPLVVAHKLPFDPLAMPKHALERMIENGEGIQFSHSLEEQIGGQLRAGFTLLDLYEDRNRKGCGVLRDYAPQYIATRSMKPR